MPYVPLVPTHKRARYELSVKRRVNYDGETVDSLAADSLQNYVTVCTAPLALGAGLQVIQAAGLSPVGLSHKGSRLKQCSCCLAVYIWPTLAPISRSPATNGAKPWRVSEAPSARIEFLL